MENEILVSVIIPAYHAEKYIEKAVDSALEQDVPLEILVIDDGSGDDTRKVLEKYRQNPDFHYLKNEKNMGAAKSRNRGVREARGRYVAFLDADDWWAPGKLGKQLEKMQEMQAVLCSTGRELVDPEGRSLKKYIPVHEKITYSMLLRHNEINCSSVVLRRDVALEFPMDHEECHEDYFTWMRILKAYGFACAVNEPLLKYRLSNQGKSGSKLKSAGMTYRTYRAVGFGRIRSAVYFISYALHGLWKYR